MTDIWGGLACPVCGDALFAHESSLRCHAGHSYDLSRQGYVNLLPGGSHTGTADTAEMVAARTAFFDAGHFEPLIEHVAGTVAAAIERVPGTIVDAGAGTGAYLAAVLSRLPDRIGVALDISKHACRRAARVHERIGAVVCDAWARIPLIDGMAAIVLSVFAPRNAAEFARVLGPAGAVVVVAPTSAHLGSLVQSLGLVQVDPRKEERIEAQLGEHFTLESRHVYEQELLLSHDDAFSMVAMGPSARHVDAEAVRGKLSLMPERVSTNLSVTVGVWRKKAE